MDLGFWLFFGAIVIAGLGFAALLRWIVERAEIRRARSAVAEWQASQPPIIEPTPAQLAELQRRLPELALPALVLTADASAPLTAGGTRIGGPVWLADGADWPTGKDGRALEFVAQLDFATMPPLPDYPETGLLQLFIGRDDLYGADLDAPDEGSFRLLWSPDGAIGGHLLPPPPLPAFGGPDDDGFNYSPFVSTSERNVGLMLRADAHSMMPLPHTYPFDALLAELAIDARHADVDALLERYWDAGSTQGHFVGGHPRFVQFDYRGDGAFPPHDDPQPSPYRDYDRVLFQLTSSDGLQWGDVGEANVMIRRDDLIAHRFDRAIWYWDCS